MKVKYVSSDDLFGAGRPQPDEYQGFNLLLCKEDKHLFAVRDRRGYWTTRYMYCDDSTISHVGVCAYNVTSCSSLDSLLRANPELKQFKSKFSAKEIKEKIMKAYQRYNRTEQKKKIELGVELELETSPDANFYVYKTWSTNRIGRTLRTKYIHDIGVDGSLRKGREIRFNHPSLKDWNYNDVKSILDSCKAGGADALYLNTAGMHIHVSGANAAKVAHKACTNTNWLNKVLAPIACRTKKVHNGRHNAYYGLDSNIVNNQIDSYGTVEFRAWAATLDAKVFVGRLKIAQYLFKFLATDKPLGDFFKAMPKSTLRLYKQLYNHVENPHEFGPKTKDELKVLMNL